MITLYKRNAAGTPVVWIGRQEDNKIQLAYGVVGGNLHHEEIFITKKQVNELNSRIKSKRKEGYKELTELKDNLDYVTPFETERKAIWEHDVDSTRVLKNLLDTYLPKYSTTEEGFVLPMLAKVLKDDTPFQKHGYHLGQYKINGLRCIIGAEADRNDMFRPIRLTYHSRTGENWTKNMSHMDEIIIPQLTEEILDFMIDEGAYLDGELYLPGYPVNMINSFVKNANLREHYLLQYWCYDICCENMTAHARAEYLHDNIFAEIPTIHSKEDHLNFNKQFALLNNHTISNYVDAINYRNKFIDLGFEGLIIRNIDAEYQFDKRNQAMFKFKKIDDGKFVIVDIIPEHKRSDLPIFVLHNDINDECFECSINKPHDVQREILANKNKYIGKLMQVEFRERSGVNQVPFHARGIDICK